MMTIIIYHNNIVLLLPIDSGVREFPPSWKLFMIYVYAHVMVYKTNYYDMHLTRHI